MTPERWDELKKETAEVAARNFLTLEEPQPGYFQLISSSGHKVFPPDNMWGGECGLHRIRAHLGFTGTRFHDTPPK